MDIATYRNKGEMREALRRCPLPPSVEVDSGHGLHAYWLFREPWTIAEPKDSTRLEATLKRLSTALNTDPSTSELDRVLRVPGTWNHKAPPAPVRLLSLHPERRYGLLDIEDVLPELPDFPRNGHQPGWIARAIADLGPPIGEEDGNRDVTFASLAGFLRNAGAEAEDIVALLFPHAEREGFLEEELRKVAQSICRYEPRVNLSRKDARGTQVVRVGND